ncbi:GspE/PulE family protein [Clostridium sp. ZS2-4]|uniref:GspE/PulE family protein n=1 Tax=Clostridium sp. ZS2-4 TaxID=2987703 RepID=UPI00227A5113|nr:GspE/PulE family protein [Clostridium sp. ZS2-4]MCY6354055.1 GspE/PulE family protein [Clostridium sp. ZS2-4]
MIDKVGNLLIKERILMQNDYNKALEIKNKTNMDLIDIILENNFVEKSVLFKAFKEFFNIDRIQLDNLVIDTNVINLLSNEIVKKYNIVPFGLKEEKVCIAMVNPLNQAIIEEVRFITNKEVIPYIEMKNRIIYAIESYYDNEIAKEDVKAFNKELMSNEKVLNISREVSKHEIENSPIVRITNSIVCGAISENASDIHFEPFEDKVNIRYRIDGVLKVKNKIIKEIYPAICTRLKIMSDMDIYKKLVPQDGKFEFEEVNKKVDCRISSMPTIHGEKIVIRILYKENEDMSIKFLNLSDDERTLINKIVHHSNGIVLVTGPTGSGKTTTLYALLNEINSEERNIITIENPVEYTIKGINQVNVNYKAGLSFATGLRSILRQDPDIIMVGEIRDEETAEIAVKAAITGHLVFSTLHTNNAPSAIERLKNMNVPRYLTSDALVAVIAQRLIREICPYCKEAYFPNMEEREFLGLNNYYKLYKGRGCERCNNTGFKGRRAVFEIMYMNSGHKKLINDNKSIEEIRKYSIAHGMNTLRDRCKELVMNGTTTFQEMMKVAYENI